MRNRIQAVLNGPGLGKALSWLVVPLLCLALPGLGVILAFVWVVALMWTGRQSPSVLGIDKRVALLRTFALATTLAAAISALSNWLLEPLVQRVVGHAADLSRMNSLTGNWTQLILLLVLSWVVGAVMEETVFRGFLIGYGARLYGERFVWPLAGLSSVIFGISHLYQGLAGMLLTGTVGLILSVVYVRSRRNLALTMLTHGVIDTVGVVGIFLGLK